jgi:hypothetical protein
LLEIKACTDRTQINALCKACGLLPSEAFYIYRAENGGEEIGAALFEVLSDSVHIVFYAAADPEDPWLFDGILRAGLNYAAQFGLEKGCIPEYLRYQHRALFSRLNYPSAQVFNITNFFQKYKNCVRPGE